MRRLYERITRLILRTIDKHHYRSMHLNDQMSAEILDTYIKTMDPNRLFLMQQDVDEFTNRYSRRLDNSLREGETRAAFVIFQRFRSRADFYSDYALSLLNTPFDFTRAENYTYDRTEEPWADSIKALKEIWRLRVKNDFLSLLLTGQEEEKIRETLAKRYQAIAKSTRQLNDNDIFQLFINSFTTTLEPHTSYLSVQKSENFDITMRLSLEGIGALLSTKGGEYTIVQELIPGGPAYQSGVLKVGDRIIGVGQGRSDAVVDIVGMRLDDVVSMIRGPKGTVVRLQILPAGLGTDSPRIVHLVRDKVRLEQRAAQLFRLRMPSGHLYGVIDIPSFYVDFQAQNRDEKNYRSTTRDVRKLLASLRGSGAVDGLIIDLRDNGGGSLREALELTGLFIDSGPLLQTRDARGYLEVNNDPEEGMLYNGPLAVLVNRNSASASEIFAGAIQDYRRGLIIGEPTFGKGTVQNIIDLAWVANAGKGNLGKLKTTIAQFYRVSGGSNQYLGIIPDVRLPTYGDDARYGERSYDNAIPWDTVPPARYTPSATAALHIEMLRHNHELRRANDPSLRSLIDRIELLEERQQQNSVSLVQAQRVQEREDLLALESEWEQEDSIDPKKMSDNKVFDLKQADVLLRETTRILDDLRQINELPVAARVPESSVGGN